MILRQLMLALRGVALGLFMLLVASGFALILYLPAFVASALLHAAGLDEAVGLVVFWAGVMAYVLLVSYSHTVLAPLWLLGRIGLPGALWLRNRLETTTAVEFLIFGLVAALYLATGAGGVLWLREMSAQGQAVTGVVAALSLAALLLLKLGRVSLDP